MVEFDSDFIYAKMSYCFRTYGRFVGSSDLLGVPRRGSKNTRLTKRRGNNLTQEILILPIWPLGPIQFGQASKFSLAANVTACGPIICTNVADSRNMPRVLEYMA